MNVIKWLWIQAEAGISKRHPSVGTTVSTIEKKNPPKTIIA